MSGRGVGRSLAGAPTSMVLAALCLAWLARLGPTVGLPTGPLRYLDIVLVPLALALSMVLDRDAVLSRRGLFWAMTVFGVTGLVSGLLNDVPVVQVGLGVLLYAAPFAAAVVVAADADPRRRRTALGVVLALAAVQVPFVLVQWLRHGVGDEVQGTMVGAGAGAHLAGAAVLVGMVVTWSFRRPWWFWAVVTLVTLGVLAVSDAKQVGAIIPIAAALALMGRLRSAGTSWARLLTVGAAVLVVLAGPVLWILSKTYVANVLRLTYESGGGKIAVVRMLVDDLWSTPVTAAFGFGPGETVSRLAWMLSGQDPSSATLRSLGLELSSRAARYQEATLGQGYVGESSFTQSLSSLLGVVGDYGLLGAGAYLLMLGMLVRGLLSTRDRLAPSAVGLLGGMVALGANGDWLEQTPIMIMIMVVAGVALGCEPVPEVSTQEPGGDVEGRRAP